MPSRYENSGVVESGEKRDRPPPKSSLTNSFHHLSVICGSVHLNAFGVGIFQPWCEQSPQPRECVEELLRGPLRLFASAGESVHDRDLSGVDISDEFGQFAGFLSAEVERSVDRLPVAGFADTKPVEYSLPVCLASRAQHSRRTDRGV